MPHQGPDCRTAIEGRIRPRIVGLSGSLRRGSYSTAILETLAEHLSYQIDLVVHPWHDVPHFNCDLEADPPASVLALRQAIGQSEGVIVATPEYNHGIPGALKNTLDWASRPHARSVLVGKPVLVVTSSQGLTGGVRAHAPMNETLISVEARLVVRPQAVIGMIQNKVRDGRLVDEAALQFLTLAVADLVKVARS